MAKSPLPDPSTLRQLLEYDPETGKLYWKARGPEWFRGDSVPADLKARKWNVWRAGKEAFGLCKASGYRTGTVLFLRLAAHRVAWAIHYGMWPEGQIDHINGVRDDNRICNLRDVTDGENKRNMKRRKDNPHGVTGVYWWPSSQKWRAQIKSDGKRHHLGMFDTMEAAVAARKQAEQRLGFHPNHGRTA